MSEQALSGAEKHEPGSKRGSPSLSLFRLSDWSYGHYEIINNLIKAMVDRSIGSPLPWEILLELKTH